MSARNSFGAQAIARTSRAISSGLILAAVLVISDAQATPYTQTNLVSNIPGLAPITDANLINPWGTSHSAGSPIWVSDQGTGVSTLYAVTANGTVTKNPLTVSIPATPAGPQGPTGQVNNNTAAFVVSGTPASFIFANLNGTISAWNNVPAGNTTAQIMAATPDAVYTGLALAGTFLYAANSAAGRIDVFDGTFTNVTATTFTGKFVNPVLPPGLVPFNVQNIGGQIFVTYAPAGRPAEIAAASGEGAVAVFDASGNFVKQIINGSALAAPWGIALAPADFGIFGGDLLVGNFSFLESEINAFDPVTGAFDGTIPIDTGTADPGGLWALTFGNSGNNGTPQMLFFNDGINGELGGLVGVITVTPEPATLALFGTGLMGIVLLRRRRRMRRI
jgi:uncharacterized protein (TIGR03118 family)